MPSQCWSISQIHHLHQVTLPVGIPPHCHQNKHKSNSLTLSPQHRIHKIYLHTSLWLIDLLPVLYPVTFPSTGYPNILLYPVPYVITNHSPSGPYLLPCFIPYTVFSHSNLSSVSHSKEIYEHTSSDTFKPPILSLSSTTTTFSHNPPDYDSKQCSTQQLNLHRYYFTPIPYILII